MKWTPAPKLPTITCCRASTRPHQAPDTIWVFTCNSTESFHPRFLSRSRVLDFSNYGIQKDAVELLEQVWTAEAPGKQSPNLARIVKEANGNVRASLMALELGIDAVMTAEQLIIRYDSSEHTLPMSTPIVHARCYRN